ncbi:DUF3293 domain-containing protein [Vibrio sinaloensis]|uniref:DUF3293 domain-containing protein n=1 Tax=Photobacterium sp. (strain ATCC 43367) TaxID=379097 RepID=UPI0035E5FB54
MMIDAQLWGEYLDPYFRFEQRPNVGSFAIVTAWNPASIWLSQEENRRNNQQLRQEIGHTYCVDVLVGNESFSWAEASFAISVNVQRGIELGRKFSQNAIYYVENDCLTLHSCLPDEGSAIITTDWRQRCR